jgi:DNA invertase Pin-like site-specific DNA recombinase/transcription elongation factor Elf1
MISYALYARKSHDDTDVTEKSLNDQLKVWRDLAAERGYNVEREYGESKSAKDAGIRPLFDDMIRRIRKGEINGILVWHVNRLARNMTEGGLLADLLVAGKIQEIRTPTEVFRQQDNILPLVLQQATATQNNRDHTAAVLRGVASRFEEGGWTHRAPVGYLNRRDINNSRRGILIRDPERFDILRRGWDKLLTGVCSIEQVIAMMNDEWGFRTRQTKKRGGSPLTRSHGYKIFTSIFYAGYVLREGKIQKGLHDPMVSIQEFHRAQEIIRARGKPRVKDRNSFAFTGLIRCGLCGQQVTAGFHRKSQKIHTYYHCSDSYRRCTKRGIRESLIEEQVMALLESITIDPALCQTALEGIARWLGEQSHESQESYGSLHRTLESIENQLGTLLTLRLREVMTDDALYKEKEAELLKERNRLRLAVQEAEEELETMRQTAKNGYDYLAFARDYYLIADLQTRKELARGMSLEFVLRGNELSITLDPLLKEMVRFTDDIMLSLEPGLEGSQSRYRASFSCRKSFGRRAESLYEPGAELQRELKKRIFPSFKWPILANNYQVS